MRRRARRIAGVLRGKGFTRTAVSRDMVPAAETVLAYPESSGARGRADALSVAEAVGLPADAVRAAGDVDGLRLTVGDDWREGEAFPERKRPEAGDLPPDAENSNGADAGACMDVYEPYRW